MTEERLYEFRTLKSTDLFLVMNLVKKIGIDRFSEAISDQTVKQLQTAIQTGTDESYALVGKMVFDIAQLIVDRMTYCQKEIYDILEATSNLSRQELEDLDIGTFVQMIVEFVKKDEFKQLFTQVVSLFQKES